MSLVIRFFNRYIFFVSLMILIVFIKPNDSYRYVFDNIYRCVWWTSYWVPVYSIEKPAECLPRVTKLKLKINSFNSYRWLLRTQTYFENRTALSWCKYIRVFGERFAFLRLIIPELQKKNIEDNKNQCFFFFSC